MDISYKSTRNKNITVTASEAIMSGIAPDGGLYVPSEIPSMEDYMDMIPDLNYRKLAIIVISKFFTDFSEEEISFCTEKAYDTKFDTPEIAPVNNIGDFSFLELYHGPTLAFKDMALSILPYLMGVSVKKQNTSSDVVILTATSGDTGKAALQGFAGVPKTRILVFYPDNGVSEIQKAQMVTQEGKNTFVAGVCGNFDDTQNAVKKILTDSDMRKRLKEHNYIFSSANSINIGRLIPQVVYYFYAYGKLIKNGAIKNDEKINIAVPTGNFGNILAAYYAMHMGLPVGTLICASNENRVLTDFFNSGRYNRKRELVKTSSPSMDILISSNLERLIYEICGRDDEMLSNLMYSLSSKGEYSISDAMMDKLSCFYGGCGHEEETFAGIKELYDNYGYVMDTHTAVAYAVCKKFISETGDRLHTLIASTASPFKFTRSVCSALQIPVGTYSDFELLNVLSHHTGINVPAALKDIDKRPVLHSTVINKESIKSAIEAFLKL